MIDEIDPGRGVYESRRAAALAGVPRSTLEYWVRTNLTAPSISNERPRLWSWADLIGLRALNVLRKGSAMVPAVSLREIRLAVDVLNGRGWPLHSLRSIALVYGSGRLALSVQGQLLRPDGQLIQGDVVDLVPPFGTGPDLLEPRPSLRILPGKLSGEPHIANTRISSESIFALARAGYPDAYIADLYPGVSGVSIAEAIDLESGLAGTALAA